MNTTITVEKSIRYLIFNSLTSFLLFYALPSQSQTFSTSYNESEKLSFGYTYDGVGYTESLGAANVSGAFNAVLSQSATNPNCVYFQFSGSNLSTSYDGVKITIPSFKTPWCQYLGVALSCPAYNTASFSQDGITSSLSLTLDLSPPSATPSFVVDWHEKMKVTVIPKTKTCELGVCVSTPAVTADESATISFPTGGFADYLISNSLSAASQASGCTAPA